jgi:hypothetical protein
MSTATGSEHVRVTANGSLSLQAKGLSIMTGVSDVSLA